MRLSLALAALACLGAATGLSCGSRADFSAASFDAVNFAPGMSLHDVTNGVILYQNLLDAGSSLFLQSEGIFYARLADGSCAKYTSDLGAPETDEFLHYEDRAGVKRAGVHNKSGKLDVLFLVNEATCYTEYSHTTFSGGATWAFIHTDHKPLTAEDREYIQTAKSQFEQDNCTPLAI